MEQELSALAETHRYRYGVEPRFSPITADPRALKQVLLNLVAHARDAMTHGGQVTIETATWCWTRPTPPTTA